MANKDSEQVGVIVHTPDQTEDQIKFLEDEKISQGFAIERKNGHTIIYKENKR